MTAPPDKSEGGLTAQSAGLVVRYREPLLRYFRRRGFGPPIDEDLAHDTFLRLFSLKGVDHVENAEAYLFQTAASVLNDFLRRTKVRRTHAKLVEDIYESQLAAPTPEHVLEGKQELERFNAALNELKPRTREVFLLARMEGQTHTQIAVRLSVSVRTVEDEMSRAIAHLMKRMRHPK